MFSPINALYILQLCHYLNSKSQKIQRYLNVALRGLAMLRCAVEWLVKNMVMFLYFYQNEVHVNNQKRHFHTVLLSVQSHSVKFVLLQELHPSSMRYSSIGARKYLNVHIRMCINIAQFISWMSNADFSQ